VPIARLAVAAALACLTACAPGSRRTLVAPIAAGHRALEAEAGTAAPLPPPWSDPLFHGVERLAQVLKRAKAGGELRAGEPLVARDAFIERFARDDLRHRGQRDIRTLYAFVAINRANLSPAALADAILDAEHERRALDADVLVARAKERTAGGERRVFAVELLRMGEGPLRFDFRWEFSVERRDRPDGTILLRYEMSPPSGRGENVAVFRGAAMLAPDGAGTRWTEVLLVGSDLVAPFFLESRSQTAALGLLFRRWRRLSGGA
jgi:hypothetical protein